MGTAARCAPSRRMPIRTSRTRSAASRTSCSGRTFGLRRRCASRSRSERTLPEKNAVRTLRRYGGMTLEEYAAFSVERDRIVSGLGYAGPGAMLAGFMPPPALVQLCQKHGLNPQYPFVSEWQETLNQNP